MSKMTRTTISALAAGAMLAATALAAAPANAAAPGLFVSSAAPSQVTLVRAGRYYGRGYYGGGYGRGYYAGRVLRPRLLWRRLLRRWLGLGRLRRGPGARRLAGSALLRATAVLLRTASLLCASPVLCAQLPIHARCPGRPTVGLHYAGSFRREVLTERTGESRRVTRSQGNCTVDASTSISLDKWAKREGTTRSAAAARLLAAARAKARAKVPAVVGPRLSDRSGSQSGCRLGLHDAPKNLKSETDRQNSPPQIPQREGHWAWRNRPVLFVLDQGAVGSLDARDSIYAALHARAVHGCFR